MKIASAVLVFFVISVLCLEMFQTANIKNITEIDIDEFIKKIFENSSGNSTNEEILDIF